MGLILRPYQEKIIQDTRDLMKKGVRRILIVAPCGSGKTALTTAMLGTAASKGLHSWFVVHRRELLNQSVQAFNDNGKEVGIISSGVYPDKRPLIQVASIHSLKNRFKKYPKPNLIYWDESQFNGAATWEKLMSENPNAFHIGLTATPCRLDGKGLGKYFDEMVIGPTTRDLIDQGHLCDYNIYMPASINTDGLKIKMGDFDKAGVNDLMSKPSIVGDVIKEYKRIAPGKRALLFAHSIEKSQEVVRAFNSVGIRAIHLDGETPQFEREKNMKLFEKGEIKIVSNVNLFSEGLNIPNIEVVIMLRPTMSLGLFIQQVGRAMRKSEGKDKAIIIDHVGNTRTHGLPCQDRDWSLNGSMKNKKGEESKVRVRTCDVCYAVQPPATEVCKFCGNIFEKQFREVEEVDGELEEVDVKALRQQKRNAVLKEQGAHKTMEQLIALGKQRGYKNARKWAHFVFQARQAKKLRGV